MGSGFTKKKEEAEGIADVGFLKEIQNSEQ